MQFVDNIVNNRFPHKIGRKSLNFLEADSRRCYNPATVFLGSAKHEKR
jgi:hypothetical protein